MIKLNPVSVSQKDKLVVLDALESGYLSKGPFIEKLKKRMNDYYPNSEIFPVANASLGIQAVLESLRIGPGDEVITSPYTFISAINAIHRVGATPVYCDIQNDYNINPYLLSDLLTEKTVAVIGTDMYGRSCNALRIKDFTKNHGLYFIQDSAQSFGAAYQYENVGWYADYVIFSFYATKNFTGGEGGVIIANDVDAWACKKLETITNCGYMPEANLYGTNMRMDEMSAALIWNQIDDDRVESVLRQRERNALRYDSIFGKVRKMSELLIDVPSWHLYPVYFTDYVLGGDPVKLFADNGVEIGTHYKLLPEGSRETCPVAHEGAIATFTLPVHEDLTNAEIDFIGNLWKDTYVTEY